MPEFQEPRERADAALPARMLHAAQDRPHDPVRPDDGRHRLGPPVGVGGGMLEDRCTTHCGRIVQTWMSRVRRSSRSASCKDSEKARTPNLLTT